MRIGITDSGVGGLSVCAAIEARLNHSPIREDVELLYLNAAIEDDYAYNSMPDRQTKLTAFDRFLHSVREKYRPDLLFIACNTLSVLYQDSHFDHHRHVPIEGIVDTGVQAMVTAFERDNDISFIIFATPTTIEEAVYSKRLRGQGILTDQVVEQACPGLPDAISNDSSGQLAANLLKEFAPAALTQFGQEPDNVAAFLGCTHYGYQAIQFERALLPRVQRLSILDPNEAAADTVLTRLDNRPGEGRLTVEFVTRYSIPDVALASLSSYIGDKAPATLSALREFTLLPSLCGRV